MVPVRIWGKFGTGDKSQLENTGVGDTLTHPLPHLHDASSPNILASFWPPFD